MMYRVQSLKLGIITDEIDFDDLMQQYIELKHQYGSAKLSHDYLFLERRECKKHGTYYHNIKNKIFQKLYPSSGIYIIYDTHLNCSSEQNTF